MNIENAVEKYFAMWNEHDPIAPRAVIRELWTQDAVSADPMSSVTGHEAIDAMVAGIQTNMPRTGSNVSVRLQHTPTVSCTTGRCVVPIPR
jgi:SnoaL-like domain